MKTNGKPKSDYGTGNARHEKITTKLGIKGYFACPRAERGRCRCQHADDLIRRYLPKSPDFSKIDSERLARIESLIDDRHGNACCLKRILKLLARSSDFEVEFGVFDHFSRPVMSTMVNIQYFIIHYINIFLNLSEKVQ